MPDNDKPQEELAFRLGRSNAQLITVALDALHPKTFTFEQISNVGNTVIAYCVEELPDERADKWHEGFMQVFMLWAHVQLTQQPTTSNN